jgi:glycosyltransferase involved in cell wall biosynthesis
MSHPFPIRVAYEVSFQAGFRHKDEKITGVGRVIEEVMARLLLSPNIDLNIVSHYPGDIFPVGTDLAGNEYWSKHSKSSSANYQSTYRSRTGLMSILRPLLLEQEWKEVQRNALPPTKVERISRKILRTLANADSVPCLAGKQLDIFHATFNPLPDKTITGDAARLITIYDIIPLRDSSGIETGFWQRIVDSVDKNQDWIVAISEYSKLDFCEYAGFPQERAFVAQLAVDESFRPIKDSDALLICQKKYKIPPVPYFLSVCNPQPRKNIPHLIHCFYQLLKEKPGTEVNLVLAGSHRLGWGTDAIIQAVESEPALKDRVFITGFVNDEDLPALYSGSLAFIFPSTHEGFGLPVLEAMQCGVPVICSNATSLPEVAGDAAILLDPFDSDGLSDAMLQMVEHKQLREKLTSQSLARASKYSWDYTARDIENVYRIIHSQRSI